MNDAPALRKADIGIAMGIAGTDVAKEAAPMILLDDNFASIVSAIEEGRAVYANIRKFTTYIFTSNTPEAWPFILQILFNVPLALPVMQILAVDLGTDILPALALGTEKPEPGLMDRPPRDPRERLVNRALILRALVWLGSIQTLLCFAGFFFFYWTMGYRDLLHLPRPDLLPYGERLLSKDGLVYVAATSMFHAGVVATQIGNAYACRTERSSVFSVGFWSNRLLLAGFAMELALMAALIYVPPLRRLFEEGPLPLKYWLFLMLYPPVMFLAEEGRKAFVRRRERRAALNAGRRDGMKVIVVGCGRMGAELALALAREGREVTVVDRDRGAFARLGAGFAGTTVEGVGFDRDVLVRAGVERSDALAALTVRGQRQHRHGADRAHRLPRAEGRRARLRPPPRRGLHAARAPDRLDDGLGGEPDPAAARARASST